MQSKSKAFLSWTEDSSQGQRNICRLRPGDFEQRDSSICLEGHFLSLYALKPWESNNCQKQDIFLIKWTQLLLQNPTEKTKQINGATVLHLLGIHYLMSNYFNMDIWSALTQNICFWFGLSTEACSTFPVRSFLELKVSPHRILPQLGFFPSGPGTGWRSVADVQSTFTRGKETSRCTLCCFVWIPCILQNCYGPGCL